MVPIKRAEDDSYASRRHLTRWIYLRLAEAYAKLTYAGSIRRRPLPKRTRGAASSPIAEQKSSLLHYKMASTGPEYRRRTSLRARRKQAGMARSHGRFLWYELVTTDVAAANAFYADVIGWGTQRAATAAAHTLFTAAGSAGR